jgi:hypothetical protein
MHKLLKLGSRFQFRVASEPKKSRIFNAKVNKNPVPCDHPLIVTVTWDCPERGGILSTPYSMDMANEFLNDRKWTVVE